MSPAYILRINRFPFSGMSAIERVMLFGLLRVMARFEEQEEASMTAINENKDKIKRLKAQITQYKNMDILSQQKREKLKTSIDLLDDIVASGTISKATIHLLVEKIIVHQVDAETIDIQFLMKGAFKNHIDLYDTLNGMALMNEETVGQTLIKVLDTVEQMTA